MFICENKKVNFVQSRNISSVKVMESRVFWQTVRNHCCEESRDFVTKSPHRRPSKISPDVMDCIDRKEKSILCNPHIHIK